jgi:fructosamine-3-kinase
MRRGQAGLDEELRERLRVVLATPVLRLQRLPGGMVASVRLVELADGRRAVVKESRDTPLGVEAEMLRFLDEHTDLPVPKVLHGSDDLLVLEHLAGRSHFDSSTEAHAAELLAGLHSLTPVDIPAARGPAPSSFGLGFDTLIGPFRQRNDWTEQWPEFYRENRLRPMTEECLRRERLPDGLARRLHGLMERLESLLDHSPGPGLVHGDVWSGNVLAAGGRVTGLLDPATYFADPEVELAFIELFGTFGPSFFSRYRELRPIGDAYRERRRDIYQIYPLLVHVALFGGGYVESLGERLDRIGR